MRKVIKVTIHYISFYFDDIAEAMKFADTAISSISEEDRDARKIEIKVTYENEKEEQ